MVLCEEAVIVSYQSTFVCQLSTNIVKTAVVIPHCRIVLVFVTNIKV